MSGILGPYIVFDGPEGCGTRLYVGHADDYLRDAIGDTGVLRVEEPGGTKLGEEMKTLLLSKEHGNKTPFQQALLFSVAHADMIQNRVIPARKLGRAVISDRGQISTFAYQDFAGGLNHGIVENISDTLFEECPITRAILLDIPASLSVKYVEDSLEKHPERVSWLVPNKDPAKLKEYFGKVCEGFREYARRNPTFVTLVNANRHPEEVRSDVETILEGVVEEYYNSGKIVLKK